MTGAQLYNMPTKLIITDDKFILDVTRSSTESKFLQHAVRRTTSEFTLFHTSAPLCGRRRGERECGVREGGHARVKCVQMFLPRLTRAMVVSYY